jgi:Ig-like domain-containing protein
MSAAGSPAPGPFRAALPLLAALALLLAAAPRASADDERKKQDILFAEPPARAVDDAPFALAARATSGLPVAFEVVSGPAVIDGKTLRLTGEPGLVIVRASQEGNKVFLPAAQAERAFTVNARPSAPAIVSQPMGARVAIGEMISLSVRARGQPQPTYQWRKDGVPLTGASDSRLTVASATPADAGTYDVTASNELGTVASDKARVSVGRHRQTLSFQGTTIVTAGQPVMLSAAASSGLPVRFDLVSGAALLNGAVMTPQGGTVVVQASQAGDATYDEAAPVTQTFMVSPGPNGAHPP